MVQSITTKEQYKRIIKLMSRTLESNTEFLPSLMFKVLNNILDKDEIYFTEYEYRLSDKLYAFENTLCELSISY